ncbi:MAG: hypothetical protein KAT35_00375 [Candidatus Aenigmarchaeota archaeon]|nr:hypothetical protein [Candidatus Aenigmarchaeota archaeon]
MDIPMCQLCKQPIWSFICPQCLSKDIGRWLPNKLKSAFRDFNRVFFSNFFSATDMDGLRCLKCRRIRLANICPHCYVAEVYDWLSDKSTELSDTLLRMLPLKQGLEHTNTGVAWSRGLIPISRTETEETDEGTCEVCEKYSEELTHTDGRWVCRDCELLER